MPAAGGASSAAERWHTLHGSASPSTITALGVLQACPSHHLVALGDSAGAVTVLRVPSQAPPSLDGLQAAYWAPYGGRAVLGVFWSAGLGGGFLFTAGLEGALTLWRLPPGGEKNGSSSQPPTRLAEVASPAGARVIAVAASRPQPGAPGLVAAGDMDGCLGVWSLQESDLEEPSSYFGTADGAGAGAAAAAALPLLASARRLHGATPIRVVRVLPARAGQPRLVATGGGDGCERVMALTPGGLRCLRCATSLPGRRLLFWRRQRFPPKIWCQTARAATTAAAQAGALAGRRLLGRRL